MTDSTRRNMFIPDRDWQKLCLIATFMETSASEIVRAAIDATIAGYAEHYPLLACAFRMADDRERAALAASEPREVTSVREKVPA